MDFYSEINSNKRKTAWLMILFTIFITTVAYFIGYVLGGPDRAVTFFVIGLVISLMQGFTSYFFSHNLVLASSGAKLVERDQYPQIYGILENLSIGAGIPTPKLAIIPSHAINAFATGRDPKNGIVAITQGMIDRLDKREIEGVIAHELSHIRNYDIRLMSIAAILVGTLAIMVEYGSRAMWFGGGNNNKREGTNVLAIFVGLAAIIVAPIIAQIIKFAISRKREFLADATGSFITRDPEGLASALEKIASDNQILESAHTNIAHLFISNPFNNFNRSLGNLFSTHPPIEERIKRLRSL